MLCAALISYYISPYNSSRLSILHACSKNVPRLYPGSINVLVLSSFGTCYGKGEFGPLGCVSFC